MWLQDNASAALEHGRVWNVLRTEEEVRLVLDLLWTLRAVDGIQDSICSSDDDDDDDGDDGGDEDDDDDDSGGDDDALADDDNNDLTVMSTLLSRKCTVTTNTSPVL